MSSERRVSYLTPLPFNERASSKPKFTFPTQGSLALKPVPLEEKPQFKLLDFREKKYVSEKVSNGADEEKILRPDFWKGRRRLKVTAMHELGHAAVTKSRGHHPSIISIIREGNTLGYVRSILDTTKGTEQLLKDKIALAHGGMLMERRIGHTDHSGAGHDMGQARYAARLLTVYFGGSVEGHMDAGKEVAKSDIEAIDMNTFEDRAEHLMEVEQIAA